MFEIFIIAVLIAIYFAASNRIKDQDVKYLNMQIDDLLMVRRMRDDYIAELQQRLNKQHQQPIVIWLTSRAGELQTATGDGNDIYQIHNDNVAWTFIESRN